MGKKKAVKLGINLGQYPNGGGGHLSQPNQINKVPGRLPFKNKTIQASSGLSKMFLVFRSTNVTMYALWVKINKFNHPISGFSNKTRFQNKLQTGIVFKNHLGRFQNIHIFLAVFSFQCVDWVFNVASL